MVTHVRNIAKTSREQKAATFKQSRRRISFTSMAMGVTSQRLFRETRVVHLVNWMHWHRVLEVMPPKPWFMREVKFSQFCALVFVSRFSAGALFNGTSCTVEKFGKTPDEKGLLRSDRRGFRSHADCFVFVQSWGAFCGIRLKNRRSVS